MNTFNTRPLGECSDFIVEEFASLLKKSKGSDLETVIQKRSEEALAALETPLNRSHARLSHLDINFMAAGLRRHHHSLPGELESALKKVSELSGLENGLLYEDLVLSNPLQSDPRLFFDGQLGKDEQIFYQVHNDVELSAAHAILLLKEGKIEEAARIIGDLNRHQKRLFKELSVASFAQLRPYLANEGGVPGPSGKYSAGVFTLDALSMGMVSSVREKLSEKLNELNYFPSTSLKEDGYAGQKDMVEAFHAPLEDQDTNAVQKKLRELRNIHFGIVAKFIPGVLIGTAGEEIATYLNGMRNAVRSALSR